MTMTTQTVQELMTRKRQVYGILRSTPVDSEDHLCASIELDSINREIRRRGL